VYQRDMIILISFSLIDENFFRYLKMLSPAATDLEIRSLKNLEEINLSLMAFQRRLLSHKDFEAVETLINLFLRIHGEILVNNEELVSSLQDLLDVQKRESSRVLELISSSLGILSFVRDTL